MEYFTVEPEVAGHLGPLTIMERWVHPPIVRCLHYEFDGWLGDELLECFPCFIVSDRVRGACEARRLTGGSFDTVVVTKSEVFRELHPSLDLPPFVWLKVTGTAGVDDFGVSKDFRLVASSVALAVLKSFTVHHAVIGAYA